MKILVLYRPDSEFARSVENFLRDLRQVHNLSDANGTLQVVDYDTREGTDIATTYGIVRQPAILITGNDGNYVKHWEGDELPLQDEVAGYIANSET